VPVRFDDSLPLLARTVVAELGAEILNAGVVIRDVTGRLAFVAPAVFAEETVSRVSTRLTDALGTYARPDRVFVPFGTYGSSALLSERTIGIPLWDGTIIRLIDRRLVGSDWLTPPAEAASGPPRFVFASIKGGVGRSTALAVAAAHRAARGDRVLAIDLDVEAPGLGVILLDDDTLPEFGVLDALVEANFGPLDQAFLADLVGPSRLAHSGGGIDVAPAFGRRSRKNPGEVLAKIARAYTEHVGDDQAPATVLDKVRALVDSFAQASLYDAIFVDSRAGLHETAASAILGLGAEVFLFGLDEKQTFHGYEALLGHMARFVNQGERAPEWFLRLTMVQGKAPIDVGARVDFAEHCRSLFRDAGFRSPESTSSPSTPTLSATDEIPWNENLLDAEVLPDEEWDPRSPVSIAYDPRFQTFNPFAQRDLLTERIYSSAFGEFLTRVDESCAAEDQP
jgi:hypothetical protein